MTSVELLAFLRLQLDDVVTPYLWSDAECYQHLSDAQRMFCRLTDGISDASTTAIVDITVAINAEWLALDPRILKIRAANRTSDGAPLEVLNFEDMAPRGIRFDGRTGVLTTLITGMEENKLRLARKASVADAIKLLVFRLPLVDITASGSPEIPSQHHEHLVPWAMSRALLKQDSEAFDKNKAQEMETVFRRYCAAAQLEQRTKRHKVRTVAYGGI